MFKKERKRGKRVRTVYINMYIYILGAASCWLCYVYIKSAGSE